MNTNTKASPQLKLRAILGSALIAITFLTSTGCKKNIETIPNNTPPYYDGVPTVLIENYVNRVFIDLIGREPLDDEMDAEVLTLKNNDLSKKSRRELVNKLMTDMTLPATGDSSTIYRIAYYNRIYDLSKARMIEGASNAIIQQEIGILNFGILNDSLNGNMTGVQTKRYKVNKLNRIIKSEWQYRDSIIGIAEMYARMMNNAIYDEINMNTFNFVNATFDDLFSRFPTTAEFDNAYFMVEDGESRVLFGQSGQNKDDYINILVNTREFYEGMIRWVYLTLLARVPTAPEVENHMTTFFFDHNLQEIQTKIMITDEYAHFD